MSTSTENPNYLLPCMTYQARERHTATVIFLHGLGDTGKNLGWLLKTLTAHADLAHVKFILPTAPSMKITANRGRIMPSWFDCYSFDHANRKEDEEGLYQSVKCINELITIEEKEHGIPPNRVVIGGISQGGAVSILTALTIEKPIAGLFALSTYIPLRNKTTEIATSYAKNIPIFWGHGKSDSQVSYSVWKGFAGTLAEQLGIPFILFDMERLSKKEMEENGTHGMRFNSYTDLAHWLDEEELEDLAVWTSVILPDVGESHSV